MKYNNPFNDIDPEVIAAFARSVQENLERMLKALEPIRALFLEGIEDLKHVADSTKILAEHGWYLSLWYEPGEVNTLARKLKEGQIDYVNEEILKEIDTSIKFIEKTLIENFPHRKRVIKSAIKAHQDKEFYLSIPVFFAQIEGLCEELTGHRFFSQYKGAPHTRKWVEKIDPESLIYIFIEPLKFSNPNRSRQAPQNPTGINRHDVMHGTSFDYGEDPINSYKALSLLNYIGETVFKASTYLDGKINKNVP